MMKTRTLMAALAALALAACGGADAPASAPATPPALQSQPREATGAVSLYIAAGSLQCSGGGSSIEAVEDSLAQAGVHPSALACGHDGRMRAQACGQPDGRIFLVDVTRTEEEAARSLGFQPLEGLPDAVRQPC